MNQKSKSRYKVTIQGIVQGVGFRPFVYQQALARRLTGYVTNTSHGVDLEVEGEGLGLDDFIRTLRQDPPPLSRITSLRVQPLPRPRGSGIHDPDEPGPGDPLGPDLPGRGRLP